MEYKYIKAPKNPTENTLYNQLIEDGYNVLRKGWPDFFVIKDGVIKLIEVKPKRGHRLKRAQHFILTQFAKAGIECYRWDPEEKFTKITPGSGRI